MKAVTTVILDVEIFSKAKANCKSKSLPFSRYVESLIKKDLDSLNVS